MLSLATWFFAIAAFAQPSPEKVRQCQWLVKVYNRCGAHMHFSREENRVYFNSTGKSALCDDGKDLPFEERLDAPDVSSMLWQSYPAGKTKWPNSELDNSPGGIRLDDFNKAVYGASKKEVMDNLVHVNFLGQEVPFSKLNGAAAALTRVNDELMALYRAKSDPPLTAFLKTYIEGTCRRADSCRLSDNTFLWRVVAGTNRLSNHSFGAAIDIQPHKGPEYWLWDVNDLIRDGKAEYRPGSDKKNPRNVINFIPSGPHFIPDKLVEVFERHGFIWGGKWYRYDLMHFEFRPEFFPGRKFPCKL